MALGKLVDDNGYDRMDEVYNCELKEGAESNWNVGGEVSDMDKMQALMQKLDALRSSQQDCKNDYERSKQFWNSQLSRLREEALTKKVEIKLLEREIEEKEKHLGGAIPPPGPPCLSFVDGDCFTAIASCIIITNIVTMTMEVLHPHYATDLYYLDTTFLLFYIFELVLKASYYQGTFLRGPLSVVWWNWMDLIIVLVGMVDLWVLPLVEAESSTGPSYMSYLRILRLARLVRVLKIVHIFLQSDLSWADDAIFQSFIMVVIGFNAILMGIEVETPEYNFAWFYVEQLLLVIFTFELVVRLKKSGCVFFIDRRDNAFLWNWLDFIIVVGGIIDQWMLPMVGFLQVLLGSSESKSFRAEEVSQVMNMLRMARLLRILRLIRLIKQIKPLYNLVIGVAKAMQGMGWVMVLTSVVLYVCALLGVKLLGPEGIVWSFERSSGSAEDMTCAEAEKAELEPSERCKATAAFPDIFGAIFNLFKVMNADMSPMEDLFVFLPATKFIFMFYVVVTNWAIFSILTAVVSDHMARVTEKTEEEAEAEKMRGIHEELVQDIFEKLDHDGSGDVKEEDFRRLINDDAECAELCEKSGLGAEDMHEFLEILCHKAPDQEGGNKISRQEFLKGLQKEGTTVNQRSMMRVEKRLADMEKRLAAGMNRLENALRTAASSPKTM